MSVTVAPTVAAILSMSRMDSMTGLSVIMTNHRLQPFALRAALTSTLISR